jgi:hypothetical protein
MKKIFLFSILLICVETFSFGQGTELAKHPMTRNDYIVKSKNQKLAGFIMLGAGLASFIIVAPGNASFSKTGTFVVIGGLAVIGSIPLFIASGRNKRKAKSATVFMKAERVLSNTYTYHKPAMVPVLSVKFNL